MLNVKNVGVPFLEETLSSGNDDMYYETECPDILRIKPYNSV